MTLVIENGDGTDGAANSYADRAFADPYLAARGHGAWAAASGDARDQALIRATAFIDHAHRFVGKRQLADQPLAWPRREAVDEDGVSLNGIPLVVRRATALLALRALEGDLAPDLDRGGHIRREKIGGAIEVEYEPSADAATVYREVIEMLRPVLSRSGSGRAVRR
ncbi:MAG: hypothetical protein NXI16_09290 [Alphaproteobacteria bacterium]|nr:hypothetical protein [Alphaproteobacteria bacterium]